MSVRQAKPKLEFNVQITNPHFLKIMLVCLVCRLNLRKRSTLKRLG